jgi:hypothetical protein
VELDEVFEDKKEADAYDKMLDAADRLAAFIKEQAPPLDLDPEVIDDLSVFLAKNGPEVARILKGVKGPSGTAGSAGGRKPGALEKTAPEREKEKGKGKGKASAEKAAAKET